MSITKFTPGPWTTHAWDNPNSYQYIQIGEARLAFAISEKDAQLIAAAPDLFVALECMLSVMSPAELENMPFAAARARAALDKATGVAS